MHADVVCAVDRGVEGKTERGKGSECDSQTFAPSLRRREGLGSVGLGSRAPSELEVNERGVSVHKCERMRACLGKSKVSRRETSRSEVGLPEGGGGGRGKRRRSSRRSPWYP